MIQQISNTGNKIKTPLSSSSSSFHCQGEESASWLVLDGNTNSVGVLRMFLPVRLMRLFFFYLSFIVLRARRVSCPCRLVRPPARETMGWTSGVGAVLNASPSDLCLFFSFFKRVIRHPRLVENHRPASSEQQESCVCCLHGPRTSSESGRRAWMRR